MLESLAASSVKALGWSIDNQFPSDIQQCVMLAAPHTSNWDALYARLTLKAMGVNVRITIKDSYMKFPMGPFIRALGGIGIDRRPKQAGEERPSMVQVMINLFQEHPKLCMLVTPSHARAPRKLENWFLLRGNRCRCTNCFGIYGL